MGLFDLVKGFIGGSPIGDLMESTGIAEQLGDLGTQVEGLGDAASEAAGAAEPFTDLL